MVTVAAARQMALALPGATEGERFGHPTFVVGRKVFAWERPFSKADIKRFGDDPVPEGPILAVRVEDLGEREAVLVANQGSFFTIPHFDGYAAVLIQLKSATRAAVKEALLDGWLVGAPAELAAKYLAGGGGSGGG